MEVLSRNTAIRTNKILEEFENLLTRSLVSAAKTREDQELNNGLAITNATLQQKVEVLRRRKEHLSCVLKSDRGEIEGLLRKREELNSEVHLLILF
jgi:hypothetical protein